MTTPAAPSTPPPPWLSRTLASLLTDVRLLLASVVVLFGSGFYAYAQVREVAHTTAVQTTAAVDASVVTLHARFAAHEAASLHTHEEIRLELRESRADSRATRAEVEGLRADLRRLFPALPPMVAPDDGGARDGGAR